MDATYRLQFRQGIDFQAAAGIVPYLKRLGASHLYASPLFSAAEGSTHGYDVVNPNEIDPVLGGQEGFGRLHRTLKDHDLGLIIDIVPNHMAVGESNPWWWDALARGADSPYASYFDIDWEAEGQDAPARITVPILGAPYAEELQSGTLKIVGEDGRFRLAYHDRRFPLSPETREGLTDDEAERLNGDAERLHAFIGRQNYRLVHWRAAPDSRNWRRFFDIDDLIGVRVDDPDVFAATHELILDLARTGMIDGVRIDHVDGLAAPTSYLRRLREALGEVGVAPDFPIYVEKILGPGEELPATWPIDGTTGYEVLNEITGVLLDPAAPDSLIAVAEQVTGDGTDFEDVLQTAKAEVLDNLFAGELEGLTQYLAWLAQRELATAEIGAVRGRRAMAALLVALPTYRVYPGKGGITDAEKATLVAAGERAKEVLDAGDHPALDLVVRLVSDPQDDDELDFARRLQQLSGPVMAKSLEDTACYRSVAVLAANEVGGHPPHAALSAETFLEKARRRLETHPRTLVPTATHDTKRGADTRARLIAIGEEPETWRATVQGWFHQNEAFRGTADETTAPDPLTEYLFYQTAVAAWPPLLRPDDAEGMRAYSERLSGYMIKAVREAKLQTKWTAPNAAFETALTDFIAKALTPEPGNGFLPSLHGYVESIAPAAAVNSLSQVLLQATVPGVPDIYQGAESWDLSLVDPDNRRVPDFARLSDELPHSADGLAGAWRDGRLKQFVTHRALQARRDLPDLFARGDVSLLSAAGAAAANVIAVSRRLEGRAVVAVVLRTPGALIGTADVPRLPAAALGDTAVALEGRPTRVRDRLSGRDLPSGDTIPLAGLLSDLPVALLDIEHG